MTHIQTGRFDSFLRRLFSIKGGDIAPEVTPEILPVVIVSGDQLADLALKSWRLGICHVTEGAGGVGNFSQHRLENPAESGVVVHVERIEIQQRATFAAADYAASIRLVAGGLFAAGTPRNTGLRDTRWDPLDAFGLNKTVAKYTTISAAAVDGDQIWRSGLISGTVEQPQSIVVPIELVLAPNTAVNVNCSIANTEFTVTYWWRERTVEPSELRVA